MSLVKKSGLETSNVIATVTNTTVGTGGGLRTLLYTATEDCNFYMTARSIGSVAGANYVTVGVRDPNLPSPEVIFEYWKSGSTSGSFLNYINSTGTHVLYAGDTSTVSTNYAFSAEVEDFIPLKAGSTITLIYTSSVTTSIAVVTNIIVVKPEVISVSAIR